MDLTAIFTPFKETFEYAGKAVRRSIKSKIIILSKLGGSLTAFTLAFLVVIMWAICGPIFHYSDSWQLTINTGTTIITFLMAFSIQFSQNRDTREIKMILKSLMKQNQKLRDQLEVIEKELEEDED